MHANDALTHLWGGFEVGCTGEERKLSQCECNCEMFRNLLFISTVVREKGRLTLGGGTSNTCCRKLVKCECNYEMFRNSLLSSDVVDQQVREKGRQNDEHLSENDMLTHAWRVLHRLQ